MKRIEVKLPTGFNELNPRQLKDLSAILLSKEKSKEYIQVWALKYFAKLKILQNDAPGIFLCLLNGQPHYIAAADIAYHSQKLAWVCEVPTQFSPLPKLCGNKPVNPVLEGEPLALYLAAENYYQAYLHTQERKYLQCLAAVLYSGGQTFNDALTDRRGRHFKKASDPELFTVFLWYSAIKQCLANAFPYLFTGSSAEASASTPDMRASINNMIRVLTAGDITKLDSVIHTETWFALYELNEKSREIEEFNQKQK